MTSCARRVTIHGVDRNGAECFRSRRQDVANRSGILHLAALAACAFGQTNNYPYILKTLAGTFPLGDGGPATSALLYYPTAAIPDAAGNLYILDADNNRIRKVSATGAISTLVQVNGIGWDMKLAADGSLYFGGEGAIVKVSPSGQMAYVAGSGIYGYSGDGGPAVSAEVGEVYALALDTAGNLYFCESSPGGDHVREVTTDGKIRTIAGMAGYGFNGDNKPATSTALNSPSGIAVDGSGNIYVADTNNSRIRKFTIGGDVVTVAGTGNYGKPVAGLAITTPLGWPMGLWLDAGGNLYAADSGNMVIVKIAPTGTLSRVAGNYNQYGSPGDGPATGVSLNSPSNVSLDAAGDLFVVDESHLVRKLTPAGSFTTMAGRLHFAGDGGPAAAAVLNNPDDIALDPQGDLFIADGLNYRIRKVGTNGTINTWGGNGVPGAPANGTSVAAVSTPYTYAMTTDATGSLYLAAGYGVVKVTPQGTVTNFAGTGEPGNAGDGGPATSATFLFVTGIALDSSGNVYVADSANNRVRVIAANTGIINAFAGSGTAGFAGDGGLATSAQLNLYPDEVYKQSPLAVDQKGNVYIGDLNNYRVRMVSPQGIISTVVGNGKFGVPGAGVPAASSPFSDAVSMAADGAGNLYISSFTFDQIYVLSGGAIRQITGGGGAPVDGAPAANASFRSDGLKVDGNGDLYAASGNLNQVWKLILNSPTAFTSAGGNNQTAQAGQALPNALKVQLMGRAGVGLAGAAVNFTVVSGSATLSAAFSQTDLTGTAGIGVTLGATAGPVVISATVPGTSLPALTFTETATVPPPVCSVPQPVVTSVHSATDFGGSTTFAPGSWLEIKGANLAQSARPWSGDDFNGSTAPTSLDGVSVTIDGNRAFLSYISPQQINVQAPADTAAGPVQLVVTTAACPSAPVTVQEAAMAPGLLAPSSFSSSGTQYLVAMLPDGNFVGNPNLIPGVGFRPAAPGETVTAYGIGFGAVTPVVSPGTITGLSNSLGNVTASFGSTPAAVGYAGLEPGVVGLYQFNLTVPNVPDGDYPITLQVGSTKTTQSVYLTVHH